MLLNWGSCTRYWTCLLFFCLSRFSLSRDFWTLLQTFSFKRKKVLLANSDRFISFPNAICSNFSRSGWDIRFKCAFLNLFKFLLFFLSSQKSVPLSSLFYQRVINWLSCSVSFDFLYLNRLGTYDRFLKIWIMKDGKFSFLFLCMSFSLFSFVWSQLYKLWPYSLPLLLVNLNVRTTKRNEVFSFEWKNKIFLPFKVLAFWNSLWGHLAYIDSGNVNLRILLHFFR